MEEEKQISLSDIFEIAKRRFWWIAVPVVLGPILCVAVTFVLRPVYTSKAFVIIEQPKVPDKFVVQLNTDELNTRLMTLKEQILSRSQLEPIILRLGLYGDLSSNMTIDEKVQKLRGAIDVKTLIPEGSGRVPSGFYITASATSAAKARQVCTDILDMFMQENLKLRQQRAIGTTEFLSDQLKESKQKLDVLDAQLADFKQKYLGQLPSDEQRNLELLTSTRTRLETVNQEASQAQQQKIIQEGELSRLRASRVTTATGSDPNELEKQLSTLQSQLLTLQSRYTQDHPQVIELKAEIARLRTQIKSQPAPSPVQPFPSEMVPDTPEIRQLQVSLRLTEENIHAKRNEQKSLEEQVRSLQSRLQLSPVVEERYKALTRDYETALQFYNDLLSKKTQSEMSSDLERRQEGEQFSVMDAPDFPDHPSFPDRLKFGLGGLGGGLALGVALALFFERREQFIRSADDVVQILNLPLLVAIPDVSAARALAEKEKTLQRRQSGRRESEVKA